MPTLIALAGKSRSGKGTMASVIAEMAGAKGLTVVERQLSGPGKQYVASAWRPEITEDEAIAWFEELKLVTKPVVALMSNPPVTPETPWINFDVSLQQYLQRMLQGARDRWGEDFWTDKLLPVGVDHLWPERLLWWESFPARPADIADICIISDLRQPNEARRVKELGGAVIEMVRPDTNDAYVTGSTHVTEQGLPHHLVDLRLLNDRDLDRLREMAAWTFDTLIYPRFDPDPPALEELVP